MNPIKYEKAIDLTSDDIELLGKLEQYKFPLDRICSNIKNRFCTLLRVYYDEKIYGILVVRGIIQYNADLCMVIDHAVAQDDVDIHFENILAESLWSYVANEKFNGKNFTKVHQCAHNLGLKKMLERHYGQASEYIFKKDVREFKNAPTFQLQQTSS